MKKFNIFVDGSCKNNPGPGGYGIIIRYNNYCIKFSQGYYFTTNNRMELKSAIISLKYIYKKSIIDIYTDSLYLKNGITKWINKWIKNNWKLNKNSKNVKNIDLWVKLNYLNKYHIVNWKWIKRNSINENIICDKLAKISSNNPNKVDYIYMNSLINYTT